MSWSVLEKVSVQTATDMPLEELALSESNWASRVVVLTRNSEPSDSSWRPSSASREGRWVRGRAGRDEAARGGLRKRDENMKGWSSGQVGPPRRSVAARRPYPLITGPTWIGRRPRLRTGPPAAGSSSDPEGKSFRPDVSRAPASHG